MTQLLKRTLIAFVCVAMATGCTNKNDSNNNAASKPAAKETLGKGGDKQAQNGQDVIIIGDPEQEIAPTEGEVEEAKKAYDNPISDLAEAYAAYIADSTDENAKAVAELVFTETDEASIAGQMLEVRVLSNFLRFEAQKSEDETALEALDSKLKTLSAALVKEKKNHSTNNMLASVGMSVGLGVVAIVGPRYLVKAARGRYNNHLKNVEDARLAANKHSFLQSQARADEIAKLRAATLEASEGVQKPVALFAATEGRAALRHYVQNTVRNGNAPGLEKAVANITKVKPTGVDRQAREAFVNANNNNRGKYNFSHENGVNIEIWTGRSTNELLVVRNINGNQERFIYKGLSKEDIASVDLALNPNLPVLAFMDNVTGLPIVHNVDSAFAPFLTKPNKEILMLTAKEAADSSALQAARAKAAELKTTYEKLAGETVHAEVKLQNQIKGIRMMQGAAVGSGGVYIGFYTWENAQEDSLIESLMFEQEEAQAIDLSK